MRKRLTAVLLLIVFITLPLTAFTIHAQTYTRDGGPSDAISAAQAALLAGQLSKAREQACQGNPVRLGQAEILKVQLAQVSRPTATSTASAQARAQMEGLLSQGNSLYEAGNRSCQFNT